MQAHTQTETFIRTLRDLIEAEHEIRQARLIRQREKYLLARSKRFPAVFRQTPDAQDGDLAR